MRVRRVVIESPYRPPSGAACGRWPRIEIARQNLVYARMALIDSLFHHESPVASHLLYTQVWAEDPDLREAGIRAGLAQHEAADAVVFYVDLGVSEGMVRARESAGAKAEERRLFPERSVSEVRDLIGLMPLEDWPMLVALRAEMRAP